MTPEYPKIILNELDLPDQGYGIIAAQVQMTMIACLAAAERLEKQWHQVVGSAG